jgi:hypothetical protein
MHRDFIYDQETGKCIASIEDGVVYRDDAEGEKIATVRAGNVYDLQGELVGYLEGDHVTGFRAPSMPTSFKKLVEPR